MQLFSLSYNTDISTAFDSEFKVTPAKPSEMAAFYQKTNEFVKLLNCKMPQDSLQNASSGNRDDYSKVLSTTVSITLNY